MVGLLNRVGTAETREAFYRALPVSIRIILAFEGHRANRTLRFFETYAPLSPPKRRTEGESTNAADPMKK